MFHTSYHIKVSLYGIRYDLLSSFYLHRVSLDERNPDAQADLAIESYASYKGQSGMILNSVLSKLTVTQLNIQCTLLDITLCYSVVYSGCNFITMKSVFDYCCCVSSFL